MMLQKYRIVMNYLESHYQKIVEESLISEIQIYSYSKGQKSIRLICNSNLKQLLTFNGALWIYFKTRCLCNNYSKLIHKCL
jgi:hypothetical protein